jgi:hypothetical protein
MGLFSSVLHLRDTTREQVLPALDAVLQDAGFSRSETIQIPSKGPYALPAHDEAVSSCPYYLVSPLNGRWLTVIEAHFAVRGAPHLADLGNRLSATLACFGLALIVHDDDVFFYNLDRGGIPLDCYNSCPQYFEQGRLPDAEIEEQRHTPEPFQPILPLGHSIEELCALLDRGWWNAYDSGNLDENGVDQSDTDGFMFEDERMTAFGNMLQLHGEKGNYPYAAWGESTEIAWPEFVALRYRVSI